MILGLIFGIIATIVAYNKGFHFLRWFLALGIIGMIWVCFLDSANAPNISEEEKQKRLEHADTVGAWLAWINVALTVIVAIITVAAG